MMEIIKVAQTNTGWTDEIEYPICFDIPGCLRGFNIEYRMPDGTIDYSSCIFIYGELEESHPDVKRNFDIVRWLRDGVPTGRAIFRGYYEEYYDVDEHEEFVKNIPLSEIEEVSRYCSM